MLLSSLAEMCEVLERIVPIVPFVPILFNSVIPAGNASTFPCVVFLAGYSTEVEYLNFRPLETLRVSGALFNLFPPFPREDKVFVAMSFAPEFQRRWDNVIAPAIQEVGLEPFRVDQRKISDSILTDITKSIANHRLIFGDISVMFVHEEAERRLPVRNANVMYEVGLAHTARLPEEVILFRSDNEYLPFDVMNIRVNSYDPDKAQDEARAKVRKLYGRLCEKLTRANS